MSHQVQINYRQISVQCASVCEVAEKQLKEIDELLAKAKEHSESLLGDQTASFEAALSQERAVLVKQITELKREAEQQCAFSARRYSYNGASIANTSQHACLEKAGGIQRPFGYASF